jgi:ABC transporter substrate binding protein
MAVRGARAQPALPVIGFLRSTPLAPTAYFVAAFRAGLREAGFVEGQNVAIEFRSAENDLARLPALVAELLQRQVAVIVANNTAAPAAIAATSTVPIVFATGSDPECERLRDCLALINEGPGSWHGFRLPGRNTGASGTKGLYR